MQKRKDKRQYKRYKQRTNDYFLIRKRKVLIPDSLDKKSNPLITVSVLSRKDLEHGVRSLAFPKSVMCSGNTSVNLYSKSTYPTFTLQFKAPKSGIERTVTQDIPQPTLREVNHNIRMAQGVSKMIQTPEGRKAVPINTPESTQNFPNYPSSFNVRWHLHLPLDVNPLSLSPEDDWTVTLICRDVNSSTILSGIRVLMRKSLNVALQEAKRLSVTDKMANSSSRVYFVSNYFNYKHTFQNNIQSRSMSSASAFQINALDKPYIISGRMPVYRKIKPQDLYVGWVLYNQSSDAVSSQEEPQRLSIRVLIQDHLFYSFDQMIHPSIPYDYKCRTAKVSNTSLSFPEVDKPLKEIEASRHTMRMVVECTLPQSYALEMNLSIKCILFLLGEDFPSKMA